jgi:hypothetical protein
MSQVAYWQFALMPFCEKGSYQIHFVINIFINSLPGAIEAHHRIIVRSVFRCGLRNVILCSTAIQLVKKFFVLCSKSPVSQPDSSSPCPQDLYPAFFFYFLIGAQFCLVLSSLHGFWSRLFFHFSYTSPSNFIWIATVNISSRVQIMKLIIKQFSPASV